MKSNLKYMLKNWIAWDKKSLIYFFIRVPALVFQPIVTAYIPKAMIDCITEGVTVGRLTLVVGLLSVLLVLTTWFAPFMQELLNGNARIIRMRYAVLAFRKIFIQITKILKAHTAEKKIKGLWNFIAAIIPVLRIFLILAINFAFA